MVATNRVHMRLANGSIISEVTFNGINRILTIVTGSPHIVRNWINTTRRFNTPSASSGQPQVVGLEVSCVPDGKIVLLQLCVGGRCLIYRFQRPLEPLLQLCVGGRCLIYKFQRPLEPCGELLAFLDNSQFCFVGYGMEQVTYGLQREHGFSVRNTADLGDMAASKLGREDLRRAGLERLAREVMRVEIEEPAEVWTSNWRRRDLSDEQIAYACAKAFVASKLGQRLLDC
ncbi:uncharacterized protein LOC109714629 [Ananas comosus]|uniref:Uncharacterized protein LOC109714629 n=1 Tax=Ananas comosus TaxID=4615 RepID=A0A6P5FG44_ANACO|nr:uncharacterized protein LOC109714629 [Ananas comosus]